jgi:hypothetical protein
MKGTTHHLLIAAQLQHFNRIKPRNISSSFIVVHICLCDILLSLLYSLLLGVDRLSTFSLCKCTFKSPAHHSKKEYRKFTNCFAFRLFWSDRFWRDFVVFIFAQNLHVKEDTNTTRRVRRLTLPCVNESRNDIAGCCWPSTIGDAYQSSAFSLWLRMRLLTCLIFRFSYLTKMRFHTRKLFKSGGRNFYFRLNRRDSAWGCAADFWNNKTFYFF